MIVGRIVDEVLYLDGSYIEKYSGSCQRLAYLRYNEGLTTAKDPDAPMFGKAFHSAMASYYRGTDTKTATKKFLEVGRSDVSALPILVDHTEEVRSLERGVDALEEYFATHPLDKEDWKILAVEVPLSIPISADPPIVYQGIGDLFVEVGEDIWYVDHKTTKALGQDYFKTRLRPNDRITGYLFLAQEHFKKTIRTAMVNVICIKKRDIEFARGTTHRNQLDFEEWFERVQRKGKEIYSKIKNGGVFEKDTEHCSIYGGCLMIEICKTADHPSMAGELERKKKALFVERFWDPMEMENE